MKISIIIAGLLTLAAASPAPTPEINFIVDVAALEEAVASSTLETADFITLIEKKDTGALDISKRASCSASQFCNAGRCKRIECFPIGTTTSCITYTYGKC
ncbi:hypothetical protein V500_01269 [Pseudogymnoascus sp. VKM F-4518 (FW-2643)]|nr:hypothetical protein V500_01269 [Pseudogymnoascus sp. VKM F-4518 (FW-2643)]KFZ24735.1 hypothetical protein V502_00796 [Pseudogymnoascus sp. VKM F-4520 (FW-2644)]